MARFITRDSGGSNLADEGGNKLMGFFDWKRREKGYTLLEVLIVATIVGILVTIGTVQYLEVKRRAKEKLATQKLSQLSTYETFYFRDFGEYATFDDLREAGYIDYDYIYEDDEIQHYHRPVFLPEYTLEFLLDEEGGGYQIIAEPVLTEVHTWYPRWNALGGIQDLRSMFVEEDRVVKWLDSGRPIY